MFDDGWEDIDDGIYAGRFADEASLLDWLEAQCRQIGCGLDRRRLYRELERNDVLDGSIAEDGLAAPLEKPVPATPTGDRAAIAASAQAIRAHSALRRTAKGQGR
jgi:hypothetical protein